MKYKVHITAEIESENIPNISEDVIRLFEQKSATGWQKVVRLKVQQIDEFSAFQKDERYYTILTEEIKND